MSTNFFVYPKKNYIPHFAEVIDLANIKLNDFLRNINLHKNIYIGVEMWKNGKSERNYNIPFTLYEEMKWEGDKLHALFYIDGIAGETDCWIHNHSELDRDIWEDELKSNRYSKEIQMIIKKNLELGYCWSFRKVAGQPYSIALLYGILAGSLAKITDGFVYSDDGAWHIDMFPATADNFFEWYLNPDRAATEEDRDFSLECINSLRNGMGDL